jgi:putative addiction module killer protein
MQPSHGQTDWPIFMAGAERGGSNVYVTIAMSAAQVLEYLGARCRSPYRAWFDKLNAIAAAKVAVALYRLEEGNFSNVKGVGGGVFEHKIDFGPGYRIYFGKDRESVVILLGGSSKER